MTTGVKFAAALGVLLATVICWSCVSITTASLRRQSELVEQLRRAERQVDTYEILEMARQLREIDAAIRFHAEPRRVEGP